MSPAEHRTNAHFKQEYVQELRILAGHFEQATPSKSPESRLNTLKNRLYNVSSVIGAYVMKHCDKLANFIALLCLMGSVTFLYKI
jgi:hypothetical protein